MTDQNEMVDRVALALVKEEDVLGDLYSADELRALARAAIEAMRVSSVEMGFAGARSISDTMNDANFAARARQSFHAMIDAALGETK